MRSVTSPVSGDNAGHLGIRGPGWAVAGAAARGRSHTRGNLPCQDGFAIEATDEGFVAVLCDGAGSAAHSALGAQAVSRAVCDFLAFEEDQDLDPDRIIAAALAPVSTLAGKMDAAPADFACTLMAVKVTGDHAFLFHLGDGAIIACRAGEARVASRPARGEYANTTVFVTSEGAASLLRIRPLALDPAIRTLVVTTDGLQDLLLSSQTGEASQVNEQIGAWHDADEPGLVAERLDQALREYFVPRTHDDCSLIVARRTRRSGETLPVVCPDCARWSLVGQRRESGLFHQCGGCGCEFRVEETAEGRTAQVTGRDSRKLMPAEVFAGAVFLNNRGGATERFSSRWVGRLRLAGLFPTLGNLDGSGYLRRAVEEALAPRENNDLDDPPVLIMGAIQPGKRFADNAVPVVVAVRQDGKRMVAGWNVAQVEDRAEGIIRSLPGRGATAPSLVVMADGQGWEEPVNRSWPQTTMVLANEKTGKLHPGSVREDGILGNPRLGGLASIRSLEREVKKLLQGVVPADEEDGRTLMGAAIAMVSARWVEQRAYVSSGFCRENP